MKTIRDTRITKLFNHFTFLVSAMTLAGVLIGAEIARPKEISCPAPSKPVPTVEMARIPAPRPSIYITHRKAEYWKDVPQTRVP